MYADSNPKHEWDDMTLDLAAVDKLVFDDVLRGAVELGPDVTEKLLLALSEPLSLLLHGDSPEAVQALRQTIGVWARDLQIYERYEPLLRAVDDEAAQPSRDAAKAVRGFLQAAGVAPLNAEKPPRD